MENIRNHKFGFLAEEKGPKEIRSLAAGINDLVTNVQESKMLMQAEVARATARLQITLLELEEAMETKDQFLANMSHELRTPLTAVMGFAKLFTTEQDIETRHEHQRVIETSSKMLLTMIDDLLEFSRVHSGHYTLEAINFNLFDAVTDLVRIYQPKAESKGLDLIIHIAEDLPTNLLGDPIRLSQVISNLTNNAVKFTEEGHVTLNLSCDQISAEHVVLQVSVEDSGKGIAQSKLPLLFEPFSQEDTSINRRFGGAGLGLSICKQLVKIMDGRIWIDSELGSGTKVTFTSTFAPGEKPDAKVVPSIGAASTDELEGLTILVAEDNAFNQKLLVKLLNLYGADCVVAKDGLKAVKKVREIPVDVVLMDIHMPVMDGITACQTIARELPGAPPIIGLTADITAIEKERLFSTGAIDVQLKPVDEERLLKSIREAVTPPGSTSIPPRGGLLSAAVDVDELRQTLYAAIEELEAQIDSGDAAILSRVTHDLIGFGGLYGLHQMRDLVTDYRKQYGRLCADDRLDRLRQLRRYLDRHFSGGESH